MKVGLRTPSLSRSISARTTGRLKRNIKKSFNPLYGYPGMGYVKDPFKAFKRSLYRKSTFSVNDVIKFIFHKRKSKKHFLKIKFPPLSINTKTILWLMFCFPIGLWYVWKKSNWNIKTKQAVSIGCAVLVTLSMFIY